MDSLEQGQTDRESKRRKNIVRFFKYAVLLVGVSMTLRLVFDGYSYYIARRSIDAELETKKASLEDLVVRRERNREAIIALYETRCVERQSIALYRVLDGVRPKLDEASKEMLAVKNEVVASLAQLGSGVIKESVIDKWRKATFDIDVVDREIADDSNLVDGMTKADGKYVQLQDQWKKERAKYAEKATKYAPLIPLVEKEFKDWKSIDPGLASLRVLEERFDRLRKLTDEQAKQEREMAEVLARYDSWTRALAPTAAADLALFDAADEGDYSKDKLQKYLDCNYVGDYRKARAAQLKEQADWDALWPHDKLLKFQTLYRKMLLRYFEQAPAAQTLFVTLLIGTLGALTLNILRLSKVGWWANHEDPDWGEIVLSPFLGALAAFGIYLVGSAGLLLTSDLRNGPTSLSAAFIGLLGFVSGLLYDEAFGRVRRVGSQIFSGDKASETGIARAEDAALATLLQGAGAARVASLVLKRGLGNRLQAEAQFTFVVPSDQVMDGVSLKLWTEINDPKSPAFEQWFRRHHAPKTVTSRDAATPVDLVMDDSSTLSIRQEAGGLKIGAATAQKADLMWEKGVIHIVSGPLTA